MCKHIHARAHIHVCLRIFVCEPLNLARRPLHARACNVDVCVCVCMRHACTCVCMYTGHVHTHMLGPRVITRVGITSLLSLSLSLSLSRVHARIGCKRFASRAPPCMYRRAFRRSVCPYVRLGTAAAGSGDGPGDLCTHTRTCPHAHTRTHAHTHAHTHTRTHTHRYL
jgi:hypothetical protein